MTLGNDWRESSLSRAMTVARGLLSASSPGIAAGELAHETVQTMDSSGVGEKHIWTLTGHDFDPSLPTERDRVRANGAFAGGTIHPHAADAGFGTVGDDLVSDGRGCHEQGGIDGRLDVLQASETATPQDIGRVGIYRNHIVTAAAELFEERDAETFGFTGDSDHCNSFLGEEVVDRFQRQTWGGHVPS